MYEEFVFLKKSLKDLEGDKYTLNYLVSENKRPENLLMNIL